MKFKIIVAIVLIILALCLIGMVATADHSHFIEIWNTLF